MKRVEAILAAGMAISLTGCVLKGKPQTTAAAPVAPKPVVPVSPPPPPPPLSMPQTEAELPPPQPVDPAALATVAPAGEAPPPTTPVTPPRRQRPPSQPTNAPTRTETPTPAATAPPTEPEPRPRIQEIVPGDVQRQLQEQTQSLQREVRQRLDQLRGRRLTTRQERTKRSIESFLKLSSDAEGRGDWRTARDNAGRAQLLLKELPQ